MGQSAHNRFRTIIELSAESKFETHGRAVVGKTNTFSAANSAFRSCWA
jgi:hypothetical protein